MSLEDIRVLKQRIEKNQKKLQRKYPLTKVILQKLDEFISTDASSKIIENWIQRHDNIIYSLEQNLKSLEKK